MKIFLNKPHFTLVALIAGLLVGPGATQVHSAPSLTQCAQTVGTPANLTVTVTGDDCVLTFTGDTSWTIPAGLTSIRFLLVGGGGGGAGDGGGGGGGGGGLEATNRAVTAGKVAQIDVGAGAGGGFPGGNGDSTQIDLNGDASYEWNAAGGSGGKGWLDWNGGAGGATASQTGATHQTGGRGGNGPSENAVSRAATNNSLGNGFTSDISGTTLYYGGGGGGGISSHSYGSTDVTVGYAVGGHGGGGAGAKQLSVADKNSSTTVSWTYRLNGTTSASSVSLTAKCTGNSGYPHTTMGFPGLNGYGGGGGGGSAYGDGCNASSWDDGERNVGGNGGNGVVIIRYTPDITAPARSSATLLSAGNQIQLAYNETLSTTAPAATRFSVSDSGTTRTVTGVSFADSRTITLTLSATIAKARTATISYDTSTTGALSGAALIEDLALNDAAAFTNVAVTNNSTVLNILDSPTTLALTTRDTSTATFTYTNTTNASSHTLRLYDSATSTLLSTSTSFTSGSTRTGLSPATLYYATLQAVGDGITYESSTVSSPLYFTTLIRKPVISSQPSSLARTAGQSATFSVIATSPDAGTLTYQWQKNSVTISGETASTLSFASTSTSDSATYRVIVTNTKNGVSDSTTSTSVTLTVSATLSITTPATGLTAVVDSAYALSLSSSGGSGGNSFAIATGTLPAGLGINSSTGAITGTPSAAGTSAITVRVTDSNSATATTSSFTITVNTANQSITFGALSNRVYGSGTFVLSASDTTTSGLPISYTSATPSTCTLSGADSRTVTLVAIGTCTINANQAGNANYNPASQVQQSFTISAGSATASISFASTTFTFGVTNTITITTSTAGTVSFKANGKIITYCKSKDTVTAGSITATCAYRPSTRRPVAITATLTPTDANISPKVSTSSLFQVVRRTGSRS